MRNSTKSIHTQSEKYQGVIQRLRWDDDLLIAIIEKRLSELFRHSYTTKPVTISDVFPMQVDSISLHEYLLNHTLYRPRDVIAFVNKILIDNERQPLPLPVRAIHKAETGYSRDRREALEDEWRSCHPLIAAYLNCLNGFHGSATVSELTEDKLFFLAYEVSELTRKTVDDIERFAKTAYERNKEERFRRLAKILAITLYKVGAIGLKLHSDEAFTYSHEQRACVTESEITEDTKFLVHAMLASALGCRTERRKVA